MAPVGRRHGRVSTEENRSFLVPEQLRRMRAVFLADDHERPIVFLGSRLTYEYIILSSGLHKRHAGKFRDM